MSTADFDDIAAWVVTDDTERRAAWAVFSAPPQPYGYDPYEFWPDGPDGGGFVAIELVAYRITLFAEPPLIWETPAL